MQELVDNSQIFTIDAEYTKPDLASIHLIQSKDRIAIVDTGTQYSTPQVMAALAELGLSTDNVELIILTHIHLDHAGGASALMELCKHAKLVVHPKGARHMANPEKLIAGTIAVYGEEGYKKLYGEITPIDATRIIQPADGESIELAGRVLTFIDSPGHANHHHCIIDRQSNSIFTGDTLGVGYRALRDESHAFVAATTTPVQFNPAALHASIERVMSYRPDYIYLTHYSALKPSARIVAGLHEQIEDFVELTQQAAQASEENMETTLETLISSYLVQRCLNELPSISPELAHDWLDMDAKLNAQGLAFWWKYRRTT